MGVRRTSGPTNDRDGVPNCLSPDIIGHWQAKGYDYRPGFCMPKCTREGDSDKCPFLGSIRDLEEAGTIACTKAMARRSGFFSRMGNADRNTIVIDEDPVAMMRPLVTISRDDIRHFLAIMPGIEQAITKHNDAGSAAAAMFQVRHAKHIADWLWKLMSRQPADGQPEPVDVPADLRSSKAVLMRTKAARKVGRKILMGQFHRLMRKDPVGTIRNVIRDLFELVARAAGRVVYVTCSSALFHVRITIPKSKRILILDATVDANILRPIFKPRPVEVLCDDKVQPAGRIIQFMDNNGPRSYLNKRPKKIVGIINAIGEEHPEGRLILISHKSCVTELANATRHKDRITVAHFGALRGRNDLEHHPDTPIAAHIVVGSPKTTEDDRRQLALAVYGRAILPFPDLVTMRRAVVGRLPLELTEGEAIQEQVWEVRIKGYADPRMQAIYDHTVTAELTQAADRARVLIHEGAMVYLVTNEPCPRLWFAEMCYAGTLLDLTGAPREDFRRACEGYEAKSKELLDAGGSVCNADVCRAVNRKPGWGKRYWAAFLAKYREALEGERKFKWKGE